MDPVVASSLITLGSNLLGGLFNSSAQSSANATNLEAVAMQNAANIGINKMNWDNVRQLWNESNDYNTPAAQRARYEEAGINPYFALSNMTGGTTQTPSAPSQIGMQAGQVQPNFAAGNAILSSGQVISDALLRKSQIDNINADTQAKYIDNQYRAVEHIQDLNVKRAEFQHILSKKNLSDEQRSYYEKQIKKLDNEIRDQELMLKYRDEYYKAESEEKRNMASKAFEESREAAAKADLAELSKEAFPALNAAQLNLLASQAFQAVQSGMLSGEMSKTEAVKRVGQQLSNLVTRNEISLQTLHITEAELKAARDGDIKALREDSPIFRYADDIIDYVAGKAGTILGFAAGRFTRGSSHVPVKGFR